MAVPTIDNKPVANPDAVDGLNNISKSEKFKKLHEGNSNFTEQELGDILDTSSPEKNSIDLEDVDSPSFKGILTETQFVALAKEYHARFPNGKKIVRPTIWGNPDGISRLLTNHSQSVGMSFLSDDFGKSVPEPQGRATGLWRPNELLSPEVANLIGTKGGIKKGDFKLSYDEQYKVLRVNNISSWDLVFNIWIDDQGNIKEISRDDVSDRGLFTQTVLQLEQNGIFLPGTAAKIGIGSADIENATKSQQLFGQLGTINNSDLASLPSSDEYNKPNTVGVLQGDARFINPSGQTDGLFTFGAGPCAILIGVLRDPKTGKPSNIGMAHADGMVGQESFHTFFNRLKQGRAGYKIEVYVLSGERTIASRILRAANDAGAEKVFFNADLDGQRNDAAIVDRNGRVYYGDREGFHSLFDPRDVDMLRFSRLSSNSLNFR